jgi:hypothetical protein
MSVKCLFRQFAITLLLLGALVALSSCRPAASPTPDAEAMITEAAATVAAQLTLSAALTPSPAPTQTAAPSNTPPPPTATQPAPAQPADATNTPPPTAAPATGQDAASFVDDVTIPDGAAIAPGTSFDKVWRIRNNGPSTWTTSYALVFIDGERMSSPDSVAMPKEVKPGETVDISVRLTAPARAGTYQGFYRLRNASGQYFRLDGSGDLWVKIGVGVTVTSTPNGAAATPEVTATVEATAASD